MPIVLGAIADDFTGATDLANTLVSEGMRVVQVIGAPEPDASYGDAEAVVVALKSRTAPVEEAIAESLAALSWLQSEGAEQILFKYCSTFDSTPQGNIGPVADALRDAMGCELALICPAFPKNGRTIYNGVLFVGEAPLAESPMKDHPLTPMRDSNLMRLMDAQSAGKTGLIPAPIVQQGAEAIRAKTAALIAEGLSYAVIDALDEIDLRTIGKAAADHKLITGGSGIALGLPDNFRARGKITSRQSGTFRATEGRALILAGSCSTATRAQLAQAKAKWPYAKVDIDKVAAGEDVVTQLADWAKAQPVDSPAIIYGSADPEEVAAIQKRYGVTTSGQMMEDTLSALALRLADAGFDRLVVAGGETSGAVVSALEIKMLEIGPEIAPGVPWTQALGRRPLTLALKSGNFGQPSFFEDALKVLP
ncbi:four-carbon acid sugar kinase family protein [Alphaproteobacteria bacterium KMM 3653]|uniref:3-oxo-tetronate kinase n=1 Tax=Harenicola maris TaxID=2841044 RepID=A0AAP2CS49_9RHOB|nr:four-carbon acid sugar kinase family protein [Harenicola maris]